jgi:subtilisin family serine protease
MLEHLDDRCLLSTSAGIKLADHVVSRAVVHQHALVQRIHAGTAHTEVTRRMAAHQVSSLRVIPQPTATTTGATTASANIIKVRMPASTTKEVERPAGTLITGAATAYDPIIGAATTRSTYNVDGSGMTVAVIDTGVDYNNLALGGGIGSNDKVIAGYDFADNTSDPMATTSQHGTAVAGLIGSEDPNDLGVAPGVNIVALRVTDDTNTASLSSIANALQWVITNHAQYNITSVNMSLSDGGNYAQNWFANDGGDGQLVTQLIGQLTAMNIPVITATGNSFAGQQGEGFAAIVQGTISVTATDLSGNLLPNAQRLGTALGGASATTIAAPGAQLTAPSGDSGTTTVTGTSFATAVVTGGVTLLQEIYESRFGELPTVAEIKSWLQQGATSIYDSVTGITIGELNLVASAALIPEPSIATTSPSQSAAASTSAPTSSTIVDSTSQSSDPTTATTVASTTTSSVQLFVNGQEVNVNNSSTAGLGSVDQSLYQQLLQAMTAWGSSDSSGDSASPTQIQVWSA